MSSPRLIAAVMLAVAATVPAVATGTPVQAAIIINPSDFQQVEMARGVAEMGEPMSLAVLPNGTQIQIRTCTGNAAQRWTLP